jgi:hypothetical protein
MATEVTWNAQCKEPLVAAEIQGISRRDNRRALSVGQQTELEESPMGSSLVFVFVVLSTTLATVGCAGSAWSDEDANHAVSPISQALQGCTGYDSYTAAIAEATIDCMGTIGPQSFEVGASGSLQRTFQACTQGGDAELLRIDRLLSLLDRTTDLPLAGQCITQAWAIWKQSADNANLSICPVWTKLASLGTPTIVNVTLNAATLAPLPDAVRNRAVVFGKELFLYAVVLPTIPPILQNCRTALSCAQLCTGGFAAFFVGLSGLNVVGDPYWWLDPNDYGTNDPYASADYYHPMSYAPDDVPGARFGDYARVGERCSRWDGIQHVLGQLQPDQLDPRNRRTWMSRCD